MKKITVLMIVLGALITSCIPNRKIAYLQYGNELKDHSRITNDSVVRVYKVQRFEYRLQPNDLLDIKISTETPVVYNPFNDTDRSLIPGQIINQQNVLTGNSIMIQGYYIDKNGYLILPVTGPVKVAGFTIKQAEDTIAAHVMRFLPEPVVRVKLINFRFSILGEVNKEATLLSPDNNLTLLQALSTAGGATEFGDLSRVKVIRHLPAGECVFYVNLLSEDFLAGPFYYVQPGDIIVVPPLKQRAYLKYVNPNLNIFATSVSVLVTILTLFSIR